MTSSRWPLFGLRLATSRLALRLPDAQDLDALADLAAEGVHDPDVQPFAVPWTDGTPDQRAERTVQYHWSQWAAWTPSDWTLNLIAEQAGTIVGTQGLSGRDFAVLREVATGSWVGRVYQGQGIGTEMRAAVLCPPGTSDTPSPGAHPAPAPTPSSSPGHTNAYSTSNSWQPHGRWLALTAATLRRGGG